MNDLPVALVLSLSASGVAVARSLAAHKVSVYGADHQFAAGLFSRYIKKPNFGYQVALDNNFLENLIIFAEAKKLKPVLLPSDDRFMEFVSHHYDILKEHFILQESLKPDVCQLFLDKKIFYELCGQHNIKYPKTAFITGQESVGDIIHKIRFPMILKPHIIHKWKRKLRGQKVIMIRNKEELEIVLNQWRDNLEHMVIQEVIEGKESDIWIFKGYFNQHGEIIDFFTGRKLRQYPPGFGSASLAESASNDKIAEISIDFLTQLKFQGLCGTELKYDHRDNEYKIIEINIRPQLWDDLMRVAGKEILWVAYCDMTGNEITVRSNQMNGIKWGYLTRDILSALWHMEKNNLLFSEWIKSYRKLHSEALFDIKDLKMFLGIPLYTFYQFYRYYLS